MRCGTCVAIVFGKDDWQLAGRLHRWIYVLVRTLSYVLFLCRYNVPVFVYNGE